MSHLPKFINPLRMADVGSNISGTITFEEMSRLKPMLMQPKGNVEICINFGVDEQKLRFLHGKLNTVVLLKCQRCLTAVEYKISAELNLSPVLSDCEASKLPSHYEPLLLQEDKLLLQDIVEDELILNLPMIAMHDIKDCLVKTTIESTQESGKEKIKDNPFAVLKQLKTKPSDKQ